MYYQTKFYNDIEGYAHLKLEQYQDVPDDAVLTRKQAARATNKSVRWLKDRKRQGNGPAWIEGRGRTEDYTMGALRAWWRELAAKPNRRQCHKVYPELPLHLDEAA